jgi:hypothetical protein
MAEFEIKMWKRHLVKCLERPNNSRVLELYEERCNALPYSAYLKVKAMRLVPSQVDFDLINNGGSISTTLSDAIKAWITKSIELKKLFPFL